jgi:hypothetical protein
VENASREAIAGKQKLIRVHDKNLQI